MKRAAIVLTFVVLALVSIALSYYALKGRRDTDRNSFIVRYVTAGYASLPDGADLAIPADEDEALLDAVLKVVLERKLSDEETSIRILKYVSSALAHEQNEGSATKIIRDGFALCGGKAQVFAVLCRKAGLPARYVGSMNMPQLRSHALSETFYDGRWHLYDPTSGVFFYSNPDYDQQGLVISFHDLVSDPYGWTPFKVVPAAGAGNYDEEARSFPVTSADRNSRRRDAKAIDSYRKDMDEAFPIAYGGSDIVSYPVDANLLSDSSQWFGEKDGATSDLARYLVRFSGSHYLGQALPPGFHTWFIKAPAYTTINIEYHSARPDPPNLFLVPLRAVKLISSRNEDSRVTFTIRINDDEASFSVYCPGNSFDVDAMHVYR